MPEPYQLTAGTAILRTSDGALIPPDPANHDYAEFLAWVAAGNTPDPAPVITLTPAQIALAQLQANDALMFRALELLIDVLLAKAVIVPTDFPPAVRAMYQARKALRTAAGVP